MSSNNTLNKFRDYLNTRRRPGTVSVYIHALNLWFAYLDGDKPSQKSAQDYIDFLVKKKFSPSTINLRAHSIKRWFKWKGKTITLDYPTAIYLKGPEYLEVGEVEKLVSLSKSLLEKTLIIMLFDTAVRISELLNLEEDDINWRYNIIEVTRKGGRVDRVNVSEKAMAVLNEWLENRQFKSKKVFGGLTYWDAWNILKKLGKRANVKVRPHIFRHSRAVQMLMSGAEPYVVQQHLGHKSIATTMNIYGRFTAADLREAIPTW